MRLLIGVSIFWLPLSLLSDGFTVLVLPAHLLSLDMEYVATWQGLITFLGIIVAMLVQPIAGLYSDRTRGRWGRTGIMAAASVAIIAALALFGVSWHWLAVLAAYTLLQVAASTAQAAQQGLLPDLVPQKRRGIASGIKNFMDIVGATLAFVLLGQLLAGSETWPALIMIGAVVLIFLPVVILLVGERPRAAQPTAQPARLSQAFAIDLRAHRAFAGVVLARFLFLLGTYAVGRFMLLLVADRLGLQPSDATQVAATLLAALTLVTALGALPAGWAADRFGRAPLMFAGAALGAAGTLLLGMAGSLEQMLLFGGVMALGSAAFATGNWALAADLAPEGQGGRFLALANVGTAGAAALAGIFGPLVDLGNAATPGLGYALLIGGATLSVLAGAAAVVWLVLPGLRRRATAVLSPNAAPTRP
jgi:MFS family permease